MYGIARAAGIRPPWSEPLKKIKIVEFSLARQYVLSDYQETGLQYFLIPLLLGMVRARWKSFHSAWQIF